jgi:hypothetical protein
LLRDCKFFGREQAARMKISEGEQLLNATHPRAFRCRRDGHTPGGFDQADDR